jgi:hypothetical protein
MSSGHSVTGTAEGFSIFGFVNRSMAKNARLQEIQGGGGRNLAGAVRKSKWIGGYEEMR